MQTCRNELVSPGAWLPEKSSPCESHSCDSKPGRLAGQELGLLQGANGRRWQEGTDPRCHSPERHGIYQGFLLPDKGPSVTAKAGMGWGRGRGERVDSEFMGNCRVGPLSTPTSPSTHSLLVLLLTAIRWLPSPSKAKSGVGVGTELLFNSLLKGGRYKDPSAYIPAPRGRKTRSPFSSPPSPGPGPG